MCIRDRLKADMNVTGPWLASRCYRLFPAGINLLAVHESDPALPRLKMKTAGSV